MLPGFGAHLSFPSIRSFPQWCGMLLSGLLLLVSSSNASADDCIALGGSLVAGECQIASAQTKAGVFNLDETLHILGTGSITVPVAAGGNFLTLNINNGGDFIIDIPTTSSGGRIVGDVSGAGERIAANITVNATGDIQLKGNGGAPDARITANQNGGSCSVGSKGGNITLLADDMITIENGAVVSANARCSAGTIVLSAEEITIDGLVESASTLTGTGAVQRPGGGPITMDATCNLLVSATGVVSSSGRDPGADLVHLSGGCKVRIEGLVESTGPAHSVPNSPPNHCNSTNRPDKPTNSTACIEVWAGDALIIDNSGSKNGEVNADTAQSGGHQIAWVDLFANGDITLIGSTTGKFLVHANESLTNAEGGLITVKTLAGSITASGLTIQADATAAGGTGGVIMIEAADEVTLNTASVFARGDFNATGGLGSGGVLFAHAFNGALTWLNGEGDVRPTGDGVPVAQRGVITLQQCTNAPINTGGTTFPAVGVATTPSSLPSACGGVPTLPFYVTLPACTCGLPLLCGNGLVDPGEQCDDGNANNNDTCKNNCTLNICGDGVLNPATEQCDDGNQINDDGCTNACKLPVCGDGVKQPGEQCDDGNQVNTDGCTNACKLPVCGDGVKQGNEQCDDGNQINDDGCTNACKLPVCGDGVKQGNEQCDDGNQVNDDGCSNKCKLPICGDGVKQGNEQCDDGNQNNYDGCSNKCKLPVCGDGVKQGNEQCDDGNQVNGDGCEKDCTATPTHHGKEGCTPGYWKQDHHLDSWPPAGFSPNQDLDTVFNIPACLSSCGFGDDSLREALYFDGGFSLCGKARSLLRTAVAAALNAAHPDVDYGIEPLSAVVSRVNTALATCSSFKIIEEKNILDYKNNKECPLN